MGGVLPLITVAQIAAPAAFGGLETVLTGLSRGLNARGVRVVLVLVFEPETVIPAWVAPLRETGITVEFVRVPPRRYGYERAQILLKLKRHAVDLVHTHGARADVVAGTAARRAGYPVVSTAHGFVRNGVRGHVYSWLQVRAERRFSVVIAVSIPLAGELQAAGILGSKIEIIANGQPGHGTQPLLRADARARLGLDPHERIAGWVGRLSMEKAPNLAIRAFARSRALDRLCIVGDGPMRRDCLELVEQLNLRGRVSLMGTIPEAAESLRAFDMLVLSSHTEGTPMVLLEAAGAGVPIVATAVGGVPDVLGDGGGLLVQPADVDALATAMDAVLVDPIAAKLRAESLSARLSEAHEAHDWIGRHVALYERLMKGAATSHPSSSTPLVPSSP